MTVAKRARLSHRVPFSGTKRNVFGKKEAHSFTHREVVFGTQKNRFHN